MPESKAVWMASMPAAGCRSSSASGQGDHGLAGGRPKHDLRQAQRDLLSGGSHLVKQGDGIAHPAGGLAGDQRQRFLFGVQLFSLDDAFQLTDDIVHRNTSELMALAARKHGGRYFMHLGGGQDENGMGRRLLERFKQGVEGCRGKHVDFVNDVDFVLPLVGSEVYLVAQITYIFDGSIGSRVDLDQVQETTLIDGYTVRATVARACTWFRIQAIDGFRQQTRHGRSCRCRADLRTGRHAPRARLRLRCAASG